MNSTFQTLEDEDKQATGAEDEVLAEVEDAAEVAEHSLEKAYRATPTRPCRICWK